MNIARLSKEEILKRHFFKCVHGHTGIEHPNCYDQANSKKERLGYIDIEASNLKADFMVILTICIKEDGGKVWARTITPKELKSDTLDRGVIADTIEEMRKYDRLIGYYSTRYDIPSIRTRALLYKLNFPTYKEVKHTDAYYIVRNKLNLHRNRLETACEFLGIPAKGHRLSPVIWTKALTGDKKSLKHIELHCKEDVKSLEALYKRVVEYSAPNNKSI